MARANSLPKPGCSGFVVALFGSGHTKIVVTAQIDVVVRRIAVLVDVEILFGQIGVRDDLGLLDLFIGDRLLRLEHRIGLPGIAAFDAGDRVILAQIVKARAALRAAVLGTPFSLDHVNSLMLPGAYAPGENA